ncbi:hypothetical protein K7G98_00720 [Saccharothrix sp. MB29]|nr:hypothetical protein [Saccharothrix sp. MB29]
MRSTWWKAESVVGPCCAARGSRHCPRCSARRTWRRPPNQDATPFDLHFGITHKYRPFDLVAPRFVQATAR